MVYVACGAGGRVVWQVDQEKDMWCVCGMRRVYVAGGAGEGYVVCVCGMRRVYVAGGAGEGCVVCVCGR